MSTDQASETTDDEPAADGAPDRDTQRTRQRIAAVLVVVLAIIVIWWLVLRVPDVRGLSEKQARLKLAGAGLSVDEVTQAEDSSARPGTVAAQMPRWFTLRFLADRVDLVVAASTLGTEASGVTPSDEATAEPDTLDMPEPAPKQTNSSPVVAGQLSTEPPGPHVPSVLGMKTAEARSKLADAGYVVEVRSRWSSASVPKGVIGYQNPAPGTQADRGTTVLIKVSTGPPEPGFASKTWIEGK